MTTSANVLIDSVIEHGPKQLLKSFGFRKLKRHFHADWIESSWHIDFLASMYNGSRHTKFTMSVWQYIEIIDQDINDSIAADLKQKAYRVAAGSRIGHLMPTQEDWWWEVLGESDIEKVANEVCQAIEAYAVPYLKKTSSIQGIANMDASYCKFGYHPVFSKASALALLGDRDAAQRVFDQLIKPFPTVSSQHQDWAKRHGISF